MTFEEWVVITQSIVDCNFEVLEAYSKFATFKVDTIAVAKFKVDMKEDLTVNTKEVIVELEVCTWTVAVVIQS